MPGDGALYKSVDGAETWSPVTLPAGVNGPNGLAIDPRDPRRMYLATWARATGTHGEGGGIYLTTDGGMSWRAVLDGDRHVYDVSIDPRNPALLYAAGFESSAWRSTDRGEHWTRIPGFNFKWGHRVIPDPEDAAKVYITTFGGSVWHGRVDGADQPVDIMTSQIAAWKVAMPKFSTVLWYATAAAAQTVVAHPKLIHDVLVNPGMGIQTFQRYNGDALNSALKWSEEGPTGPLAAAAKPSFPARPSPIAAGFGKRWSRNRAMSGGTSSRTRWRRPIATARRSRYA